MSSHIIELQAGEHIVREVRRDLFVFYGRVLVFILLSVFPLLFIVPLIRVINTQTALPGGTLVTIGYLLWFLLLWVLFFLRWTDYYLDVWIITNRRIFDIEQKGMFHRDVSVFMLESIQDVTVEIKGILATFLKFGNIHIHTAGEKTDITIRNASEPLTIKRIIMEEHARSLRESHQDPSPPLITTTS